MNIAIDLGSRFVKTVEARAKSLHYSIQDSLEFYHGLSEHLKKFSHHRIFTTGYGRYNLKLPDITVIPEIQAHVRGAARELGITDFTLLDIGGQDTKVSLVRKGKIMNFLTNDKCAASSGRFLENMSVILKIEISDLLAHYENPEKVSATCAIFSESEIISLIVAGAPVERIAAGINQSLYQRIKPWLLECRSDILVLSGGIAESLALRCFISRDFPGSKIISPERPQFLGALGCLPI
ncbi:MAG: acyl-CoA dehydratase activase [Candidatus Wallbacteria bacterium]|nr:acyl-CoA dehydratase activase [Candidatus Wallbacteria bacterium]